MSTEENKTIESRILEEALTKHNLAIADELIDTNWIYHGTGGMDFQGREGFRQMHTMLYTAFPDLRVKIEDMVAEGDKVVSRFTVSRPGEAAGPLWMRTGMYTYPAVENVPVLDVAGNPCADAVEARLP